MTKTTEMESQSQLDKFKQASRDLETDNDPDRFAKSVRAIAKSAPRAPKRK